MTRPRIHRLATVLILSALLPAPVPAATLYWDGTGSAWNTASSWSTASNADTPDPLASPGAADIASFNISSLSDATVSVSGNQSALGLVFNGAGPSVLQSGAPFESLSVGASGITINSGAGPVTSNLTKINAHV